MRPDVHCELWDFPDLGGGRARERQEDGAVRSPVAHFRVQASLKEG